MGEPTLPGIEPDPPRKRGRPKGSGNRRSADLGKMIAALFGSTPGEQMARIGLVTAKEVRQAREFAVHAGLDPLTMAMVTKAKALARQLRCKPLEAWQQLEKERADLMPYVHQRQAQAVDLTVSAKPVPTVLIPEPMGPTSPVMDGAYRVLTEDVENQGLSAIVPSEVSQPKSHDEGDAPEIVEEP